MIKRSRNDVIEDRIREIKRKILHERNHVVRSIYEDYILYLENQLEERGLYMKPILEKERLFLQKYGIDIPQDCLGEGSKIYLNTDDETLIIQFKVKNQNIIVKKNKLNEEMEIHKKKSSNDDMSGNNDRLNNLERVSIDKIVEYINRYKNSEFRVSDTRDTDSLVFINIFQKALEKPSIKYEYEIVFLNTSNDKGDTHRQIKSNIKNKCKHQLSHKLNREPIIEDVQDIYNLELYALSNRPALKCYQWWLKSKYIIYLVLWSGIVVLLAKMVN